LQLYVFNEDVKLGLLLASERNYFYFFSTV